MPSRSHSSPELQINTKKPPPRVIHKNVCGLATTKLHSLAFPAKTNYKAQTLAPFGRKINFAIAPSSRRAIAQGRHLSLYIYIYICLMEMVWARICQSDKKFFSRNFRIVSTRWGTAGCIPLHCVLSFR